MSIYFEKIKTQEPLSPEADISSRHNVWIVRFKWLIPVCVVLALYYVGINNYFTSDDFMWINRVHTFKQNWLQIFRPEGTYFDPLVHLMFVVDYLIAGLNPRWYHCVDLAIHAVNSLLVYRFARLLTGDERAALYGSILFAGSFAIADAVLWSSSRVDLLATFFTLGALLQFLRYLRGERSRNLVFSFLLFVLALCAKGTPIILPVILLFLIILEKKPLRFSRRLVPFGVVAIIYLALLKLTAHLAAFPVDKLHFNLHNIAVALCVHLIPEETLTHLNLAVTATLLFITVSVLGLSAVSFQSTIVLRRTGYLIFLAASLPVLVLGDFTIVTRHSNFIDLMGSPSHRIYLASVGIAILGGGFLRSIEERLTNSFPKFASLAVVLFLLGIVAVDAFLIRERDLLWETEGNKARAVVDFFHSYRSQAAEGSQIGLIGFPTSRVYMESIIKNRLGVKDATFNYYVDIGMLVDSKILQKAEKSFLFVFGRDGNIYDFSQMYRQQLLLSRRAISNFNNPDYISEAQTVTINLARNINQILGM